MNLINERSYAGDQEVAGPEGQAETYQEGAPEIGTKFNYQGKTYACCGWMTELSVPGQFGKRGGKLVACRFDQATWVIGMGNGGPGTIAPMNAIQVTGKMKWTEEQRKKVVDSAMSSISKKLTLDKPRLA